MRTHMYVRSSRVIGQIDNFSSSHFASSPILVMVEIWCEMMECERKGK